MPYRLELTVTRSDTPQSEDIVAVIPDEYRIVEPASASGFDRYRLIPVAQDGSAGSATRGRFPAATVNVAEFALGNDSIPTAFEKV